MDAGVDAADVVGATSVVVVGTTGPVADDGAVVVSAEVEVPPEQAASATTEERAPNPTATPRVAAMQLVRVISPS
ncbi:hypothetical protein GORHZ_158_00090 [Gordonia rhizosphera NBRC 16068]|uniref:Uncharacterized protein n=1 Tax=Gordonia rhizosphera NBRC 16068 TaxID=1108045 RepID=K6WIN6_9ACTN|nr:hypothetical protein GORHZ_158_00090 [Gordonia rhizosphera NBRC 16068]